MPKLYWKQLWIGALVEIGSISVYRLIQDVSPGRYDFELTIDRFIPFWPSWIWIYVSVLPIFLYAALTLRPEIFNLTLKRVVSAHFLTYPFFFIFLSDYPRPDISKLTPFYEWGYGVMHSVDQPNNTFPSLHVSLTLVICHMLRLNGSKPPLVYGYAAIICLSTMITKQHFFWDVVGGVGIFLLTLLLPFKKISQKI